MNTVTIIDLNETIIMHLYWFKSTLTTDQVTCYILHRLSCKMQ